LEDNQTLKSYDRDDDKLNDFDELFVYYTNPFDNDTDNDGYSDFEESDDGTNPNDFNNYPTINRAPNTPIGSGPTSGKIGKALTYNFILTDPDDDEMYLWIDWGDGEIEEWIGTYESDEIATISHTWERKGTFKIQFKAKDLLDLESDWGSLDLTIPRSKSLHYSFFQNFLENLKLNFYYNFTLSQIIFKSLFSNAG